ncbi:hypothetical protein L1987_74132 [Smallanthus sonchifolius]|uniref:Uncharacterized protein n=1 Tax=Smallanthus sonchifolius TaxID=185202 RepID=A0ACB9A2I1_9ASTR|nr:hypothetical protein L1987_74132 [Smallanthus sonchifolius]
MDVGTAVIEFCENNGLICGGFGLHITLLTSSNQITKLEGGAGSSNSKGILSCEIDVEEGSAGDRHADG